MTNRLVFRTSWTAWLVAASLVGSAASAQSPPADPSQAAEQPPPDPNAAPTVNPVPNEAKPAVTYPAMGKSHELMMGPETWFRFGLQAQVWADLQQSSAKTAGGDDGGYSANLFLRRARVIIGGQFFKNVNAWFQLDAPRLGMGLAGGTAEAPTVTKRFNAQDGGGEILQDAWVELKLAGDAFMIEGGLMVIPFSHNELQSTTTFIALDVGTVSTQTPFTSGTRDVGFQLKGYVLDEKLEYRAGIFSGLRQTANGDNPIAHNFFRLAAKLQYQIFDVEKGYVYAGHTFGKKKSLGVSTGIDYQKADGDGVDAYLAFSAGVYGAWPLAGARKEGGDELAFLAEYYHFDGGETSAALIKQNDLLAELGYYNKELKLSVFGKFEMRKVTDDATDAQKATLNTQWFGGGIKYYIAENFCNFTLAYNRVQFPDKAATQNNTNQFTLQMQVFYY